MNTGKRIPATLTAILAILALTACGETPARLPLFGPRLPRPPHRTRKEPTMSTRLYYDQYGIPTDISELEAWSE